MGQGGLRLSDDDVWVGFRIQSWILGVQEVHDWLRGGRCAEYSSGESCESERGGGGFYLKSRWKVMDQPNLRCSSAPVFDQLIRG